MHLGVFFISYIFKANTKSKKISEAKQQENITSNCILKKSLIENLNHFLKITKNIYKKKKRFTNGFRHKLKMGEQFFGKSLLTILTTELRKTC